MHIVLLKMLFRQLI